MTSYFVQHSFGRTCRMSLKLAGTYSSISDTSSPSLLSPPPSRPIQRGLDGPGLLGHVLVAKYADHLPLYRQSEIYAREGVDLDRSTLAGWVGLSSHLLSPLLDQLRCHVLAASKLHADDAPVPVAGARHGQNEDGTALDLCAR
jgi:hypothetical protein